MYSYYEEINFFDLVKFIELFWSSGLLKIIWIKILSFEDW